MRRMDENFDIIFVVGGERFPAHRAWISANSPKLGKILKKRTRDATAQEVNLPDLRPEVWRKALDYIYFENVSLPSATETIELLECAEEYELESLQVSLTCSLVSGLQVSNCCEIFAEAARL